MITLHLFWITQIVLWAWLSFLGAIFSLKKARGGDLVYTFGWIVLFLSCLGVSVLGFLQP